MTVIVATTTCAAYMDQEDTWGSWLLNAEAMQALGVHHGYEVKFFAALEVDARGTAPFQPLIDRLVELGGEYYTFMLDDGRREVRTTNRLRHITMGQNICTDYAVSDQAATHLLFMAADTEPPADAIDKLREMDWPIVGGEVPTYGLTGPAVTDYDFPVEAHMATAAFIMLHRDLFRVLRWRWDFIDGSDDPCMHVDALRMGWETRVRKDCVGKHYPEIIGPVEMRGHDMAVRRA